MEDKTIKIKQVNLFFLLIFLCIIKCKPKENIETGYDNVNKGEGNDSLSIRQAFASSPVISPDESLTKIKVENGFQVILVASEPLVSTPVALTFDSEGRIWVVEMSGYMPGIIDADEGIPNGKIVILDDTDNDGIFDDRKVFLDSLILPRALCLIENGILIAEPPNLWFFEIKGRQAW